MDFGTCYAFLSSNEVISFPSLDCSDGDVLQLDSPTLGEDYTIYGGRLFKVRQGTFDSSDFEPGLVLHVWNSNDSYFLDMNFVFISSVIFIALFFTVLFRWFIRLRG